MKKILIISLLILNAVLAQGNIKTIGINEINASWEIELLNNKNEGIISASTELNGSVVNLESSTRLSTVIYVLIDSSIPMKNAYRKGIKPFLKENVAKLEKENAHVVISTFDKNLVHIYNSMNDTNLTKALEKIKILGQTTELWRNTMNTLKEMEGIDKLRKVLVLISDGDAEDTPAYSINEVINFAKSNNIRVASLAYRDKIVVQNLRKISEETNGKIWIADKKSHKLTKNFFKEFNQLINSQFVVSIPKYILSPSLSGEQDVAIMLKQNKQVQNIVVTLATEKIVTSQSFLQKNKLYLLIGAALILLLLLLLLLKPRKEEIIEEEVVEEHTIISEPIIPEPKPVAFLESMGGTRHKIFKFPSTIGKKESNDVIIPGQYISRNHAVIALKDGVFELTDIDSANGTKVNGEKVVGTVQIKPKDKIEFGPYETTFILN